MVYRPGQEKRPSHLASKLTIMLDEGLDDDARKQVLAEIRKQADVKDAQVMDLRARSRLSGRIVTVTTKDGADDQKVADAIGAIKGVASAERTPLYHTMRGPRPGLKM